MLEFHPGTGPDSEAVGIALEEGFLDYRVMKAGPVPIVVDGHTRLEGMEAILPFLADRIGRFLPEAHRKEAADWIAMAAGGNVDLNRLEKQLAGGRYILGEFSIADMAVYPLLRQQLTTPPASIATWLQRMKRRTATGRGLGAIGR